MNFDLQQWIYNEFKNSQSQTSWGKLLNLGDFKFTDGQETFYV